jgi:hypothetical protein
MNPSNFLKIHLNIILPTTSWSLQWQLSLRLPPYISKRNEFTFHIAPIMIIPSFKKRVKGAKPKKSKTNKTELYSC